MRRSRKQERDGAKRYGGMVNIMSGAGDVRKNDVRTATESIEFKGTTAASYRLRVRDLITAWRHAIMDGRNMVFGIEFYDTSHAYYQSDPRRYVVIPEDDYLAMREEIENDGWRTI